MKQSKSNRLATTIVLTFLCVASATVSFAQQKGLGMLDGQTDIGNGTKPRSTTYDAAKGTYTVAGAGTHMCGSGDELHIAWLRLKGNFILTTRAEPAGKGVAAHREIGW